MSVLSAEAFQHLTFKRMKSALLQAFAGDAVAMPVHWFYEPATQIPERLGTSQITKMEPAPATHPYTFMPPPEPDSSIGGRRLVGDVILKAAAKNWGTPNQHVHHGMAAGENTLNAHCARLTIRVLAASHGRFDEERFLREYVAFMTSPEKLHPDTYAESSHRNFFLQLAKGLPPNQCADPSEDSNAMGGLVRIVPVVLSELLSDRNVARVQKVVRGCLSLTAPHAPLSQVADTLVVLVDRLLFRKVLPQSQDDEFAVAAIRDAAAASSVDLPALLQLGLEDDKAVVGGAVKSSCGIADSWPALLFLSAKYWGRPDEGLLANANVGGENCHRGFVLGAILGLRGPLDAPPSSSPSLTEQLANRGEIVQEVDDLVKAISP